MLRGLQSGLLLEARRQLSTARVDLESQLGQVQEELKKANSTIQALKAESASLVRLSPARLLGHVPHPASFSLFPPPPPPHAHIV